MTPIPRKLLVPLLALLGLSACIPQRRVLLLQDLEQEQRVEFALMDQEEIRIQPEDFLFVRLQSFDEQSANFFNPNFGIGNQGMGMSDLSLLSYWVDREGQVDLPMVGRLEVAGRSLAEAKALIEAKLASYVNQPFVVVAFANKNVTILGEVNNPGSVDINQYRMNIFQALASAGDFTTYANRDRVQIVREQEDTVRIHELDLRDRRLLESEFYYLQANDVVYVRPMKAKMFGIDQLTFGTVSSVLSLGLLIYSITNRP